MISRFICPFFKEIPYRLENILQRLFIPNLHIRTYFIRFTNLITYTLKGITLNESERKNIGE